MTLFNAVLYGAEARPNLAASWAYAERCRGARSPLAALVEAGFKAYAFREWEEAYQILASGSATVGRDLRRTVIGMHILAGAGRFEEGAELLSNAIKMDRTTVKRVHDLSRMLLCARRYDEARHTIAWSLRLNPDGAGEWEHVGLLAEALGDTETMREVAARNPTPVGRAIWLGLSGDRQAASAELRAYAEVKEEDLPGAVVGLLALAAGFPEQGARYIAKAMTADLDPAVTFWIRGLPIYRHFRAQPEFRRFLREVMKVDVKD